MNKRKRKKMERKCLVMVPDETRLLMMTEQERAVAYEDFLKFKKQYGYKRKYKDLKNAKPLHYIFPLKITELEKEIFKRCRRSGMNLMIQHKTNELNLLPNNLT